MTIPCQGCEMRAGCQRDQRCYRPRTRDHAIKECKEANEALVAAVARVNNAILALKLSMEAEQS